MGTPIWLKNSVLNLFIEVDIKNGLVKGCVLFKKDTIQAKFKFINIKAYFILQTQNNIEKICKKINAVF